jgi:phytoene dehydrogenase-like protein
VTVRIVERELIMEQITVVGGGLGGLVAAVSAAERGHRVVVYEAHCRLGGRAATTTGPFRANQGPHVVYDDGPLWAWLHVRRLAEPAAHAPKTPAMYFRIGGKRHRVPPLGLLGSLRRVRSGHAPVEATFMEWATALVGEQYARQLANFAGVVTFDHDPGRLSAAFVQERIIRATKFPPAARYIPGGWSTLIDRLANHAKSLGVEIVTDTRISELPDTPTVLAIPNRNARALLGATDLADRGSVVATLDVGLDGKPKPPFIVSDLDTSGWVETFSRPDPTLAPRRQHLVQAQAGMRPGETLDEAVERLETLLDVGVPGWRTREVWRRRARYVNETGALDLPNQTWRDRPAVQQRDTVMLVNDQVAAPGVLAEVSFNAAIEAVRVLTERPIPLHPRRSHGASGA